MRALVTGAAGFIGHHVVHRILSEEGQVVGVDSMINGDAQRVASLQSKFGERCYRFHRLDICDMGGLMELFRKEQFDCVFHLAALGSVPRSIADPCATLFNNVVSTANLLWCAHKFSALRFVYSSSASVYGNSAFDRKDEAFYLEPCNPYGVSKLAAEKAVRVFWQVYGLPTVSLRYFNVFGPGQSPAGGYAAVIPAWLGALEKGEPMIIHGDGEQRRDFTYVSNVVEANMLAASAREDAFGEDFNIGCSRLTTINEMSRMVESAWGAQCAVKHIEARKGDIRASQASIAKAVAVLGYTPKISVEEGIQKTVEWFRAGMEGRG